MTPVFYRIFYKIYRMKKVLVSTTDSLSGWQVESYLGPVHAAVVMVGWNASAAGLPGEGADNLERRLGDTHAEARKRLEMHAAGLGGNCILGLKTGVRQVSGLDAQLFLVTATGTAVAAGKLSDAANEGMAKAIDKDKLNTAASLLRLAEQVKDPSYKITKSDLQLIAGSRAAEFAGYVFQQFNQMDEAGLDAKTCEAFDHLYREYFTTLEPAVAARVLCSDMLKIKTKAVFQKVLGMIKDYALVDFDIVSRMLNGEIHEQKMALVLLQYDKTVYTGDDVPLLQGIIGQIERAFPLRARIATKKGFLSSEDKEIWVCECRQSNDADINYCANCGNDKYGFKNNEAGPERTIALLRYKAAALQSLL